MKHIPKIQSPTDIRDLAQDELIEQLFVSLLAVINLTLSRKKE